MSIKCSMKCVIDKSELLKGIAKAIKVDFLTPDSQPDNPYKIMGVSDSILESVAEAINELREEKMRLVQFAKFLDMDKYIDEDKLDAEIKKELKDSDMPEVLKDLLGVLFKHRDSHEGKKCTI